MRPDIAKSRNAEVTFGKRSDQSIITALIKFPFVNFVMFFVVHISDEDLPVIIGPSDMECMGIYYNKITDHLTHIETGKKFAGSREFGHGLLRYSLITNAYIQGLSSNASIDGSATPALVSCLIFCAWHILKRPAQLRCQFWSKSSAPTTHAKVTHRKLGVSSSY